MFDMFIYHFLLIFWHKTALRKHLFPSGIVALYMGLQYVVCSQRAHGLIHHNSSHFLQEWSSLGADPVQLLTILWLGVLPWLGANSAQLCVQ